MPFSCECDGLSFKKFRPDRKLKAPKSATDTYRSTLLAILKKYPTMKFLLLSVFLSICNLIFSQSDSISANNFNIPNDIKECISGLDKVFSQPAKNKFKSLNKDTLGYLYDIFKNQNEAIHQ